jgi:hypothetical protein
MNKYLITIPIVSLLIGGCSTIGETTLLGAGMGGALGTGIGLATGKNTGGAIVGTGIGAVLGAGLFYLAHKEKEEKNALTNSLLRKKMPKEEYPTLRAPEASCSRVGEKIEGTKYIGPHIICEIEKPAVWGK